MSKKCGRIEILQALRDEPTVRGILAMVFVGIFAFFMLSSIVLGGASLFVEMEGQVAKTKEIIVTLSGIFSGPLGIIIGYYFRAEIEREPSAR